MRLVLLRHGKAEPKGDGADRGRTLTPLGEAQARSIGEALRARGLLPDAIVASPAPRALQTARLAAQAAHARPAVQQDPQLYEASVRDVLAAVERHAAAATLWVVGHNPSLEDAASLLGGSAVELGVACAAVVERDGRRLLDVLEP